jgi:hypothetical protein
MQATRCAAPHAAGAGLCATQPGALYAEQVLTKLPGWVIDDDASVREEVAEWKGKTPLELWRLARLCSRDAMWAVRASGDPRRILEHVDALPESTLTALARLRAEAGWDRGDR